MVQPFDPGALGGNSEFLASIDDKIPDYVISEIARTVVDETGCATREVVASGGPKSLIHIFTVSLEIEDSEVGRLVLSPRRWDISSEMAHNLYVRYRGSRIVQFFFHIGRDREEGKRFINEWQRTFLVAKARNPRYKMRVRELVAILRDAHLSSFWRL